MPIGFHPLELVVLLAILLLIFGPKRLPEMGSAIGKSIKEFRKGMSELTSPKDEHEEEKKLPASTADTSTVDAGKLSTTVAESEANIKATTTTSESSSTEVKID
jgi:sec-independent protein translocase protein TatA